MARDNTVKFHRHTLQILSGRQRPSYAGAVVVVLEGLDGRLSLHMRAASAPPRRRRPVRERSEPAPGILRLAPPSLLISRTGMHPARWFRIR